MGPGQQIRDHLFVDGALVLQQPQDLVAEVLFENFRTGGGVRGEKGPILCEEAPGNQQVYGAMPGGKSAIGALSSVSTGTR
jgi:hypothetical protein